MAEESPHSYHTAKPALASLATPSSNTGMIGLITDRTAKTVLGQRAISLLAHLLTSTLVAAKVREVRGMWF